MEQEQEQKQPAEDEEKIIMQLFSTALGIAGLKVLKNYFYDRPDYNPTRGQPYDTYFKCGQRDVIGWIIERTADNDEVEEVAVKKNL